MTIYLSIWNQDKPYEIISIYYHGSSFNTENIHFSEFSRGFVLFFGFSPSLTDFSAYFGESKLFLYSFVASGNR